MTSATALADAPHRDGVIPLDVRAVTKRFRKRLGIGRRGTGHARLRAGGRRVRADGHRASTHHIAVDAVTFQVQPGEIYGVIGANGSGKSTLIRMLSTLLLPDSGAISVFGMDAVRRPREVRALVNRVSADPSFFRAMSPEENLLFYGRAYGMSGPAVRRLSREILDRLGLEPDRLGEPMLHLSRGQQQKVALCRAFLTSPRLMLLDEPTTGLDPRSKRDVQTFVAEARDAEQVSVLLTTHDMDEAEALCDRLAFLAGGRIVAEGTPAELKRMVAGPGAGPEDVGMEEVFIELTGRGIEEDEEDEEDGDGDG